MTDPETADRTYIEPLTVPVLERIIARERPDALLPTMGGQTGLNLAMDLHRAGVLERYGVELIGASAEAIDDGRGPRACSSRPCSRSAWRCPRSHAVHHAGGGAAPCWPTSACPPSSAPPSPWAARAAASPTTARTLTAMVRRGLEQSPVHQVLVEESVIGWKEFELEVMRDADDNFVVICSIENLDPMGVHTGDSITVAPGADAHRQGVPGAARSWRAA